MATTPSTSMRVRSFRNCCSLEINAPLLRGTAVTAGTTVSSSSTLFAGLWDTGSAGASVEVHDRGIKLVIVWKDSRAESGEETIEDIEDDALDEDETEDRGMRVAGFVVAVVVERDGRGEKVES